MTLSSTPPLPAWRLPFVLPSGWLLQYAQDFNWRSQGQVFAFWMLLGALAFALCSSWMPDMHLPKALGLILIYCLWTLVSTLVWAVLQQYSAWFFDAHQPFGRTLGVATLGTRYYAVAFLASLPLVWLWKGGLLSSAPLAIVIQLGLLSLNLIAVLANLRLFARYYQETAQIPRLKSWGVAAFPVAVVVVLYSLTQVMTWVAIQHKL